MENLKTFILFCVLAIFAVTILGCFGECPPGAKKPDPKPEKFTNEEIRFFPYSKIESLKLTIYEDSNTFVIVLGRAEIDSSNDCNRIGEPCGNCMSQKLKYINYHFSDDLNKCDLYITHISGTEDQTWNYNYLSGIQLSFYAKKPIYVGANFIVKRGDLNKLFASESKDTVGIIAYNSDDYIENIVYSKTNGFVEGVFDDITNYKKWSLEVLR